MNRGATAALVILAGATLWAVSPIGPYPASGRKADLEAFIQEVRSRPAGPVNPPPVFEPSVRYRIVGKNQFDELPKRDESEPLSDSE